jgi:hypothetical protein
MEKENERERERGGWMACRKENGTAKRCSREDLIKSK